MIIGRDRERAQLRELLNDAIAGHGSLVLISGEAQTAPYDPGSPELLVNAV